MDDEGRLRTFGRNWQNTQVESFTRWTPVALKYVSLMLLPDLKYGLGRRRDVLPRHIHSWKPLITASFIYAQRNAFLRQCRRHSSPSPTAIVSCMRFRFIRTCALTTWASFLINTSQRPFDTFDKILSHSIASSSFAWISTASPFSERFSASFEVEYIIFG